MRWAVALALAFTVAAANAQRLLLVPLDNRPAAGQFAQMIGSIAGAEVYLPPYSTLGQFTQAGSPDEILDWLDAYDYADVSAVIVSTDMIAYGGLIASRTNGSTYEQAIERLRRLATIRRKHPETKFYAFSAITRLYPTATRAAAPWRIQLGRYAQLREQARSGKTAAMKREMAEALSVVPRGELRKYDQMRLRNVRVQRDLVRMTATGVFDYLMLGQDDATAVGPNVRETARLRSDVAALDVQSQVYFCEGIDQHSNILVSRALLRKQGLVPRVRVVYSDEARKNVYANFESKPLWKSVSDQLFASGARPMEPGGSYDYTLYVNTPKPSAAAFAGFLSDVKGALDSGQAVAIADVNLSNRAAADPRLFAVLTENHRAPKLLAYAGWNTAGNTVGTSIPAANMVILGRHGGGSAVHCEVARQEFVLHRLVNDFAFHTFTRPAAYSLISNLRKGGGRDEIYGDVYATVSSFVKRNLQAYLNRYFDEQFKGQEVDAGGKRMTVSALDHETIWLPWPRAYEVRLEFRMVLR